VSKLERSRNGGFFAPTWINIMPDVCLACPRYISCHIAPHTYFRVCPWGQDARVPNCDPIEKDTEASDE
jgi:hypothetical protein